jgi:hypothetical protein
VRDQRFVALHRGGLLSPEHHRLLIGWAHDCAEHLLQLFGSEPDERLTHALEVAKAWERGEASVGQAQKAAVSAHAVAREAVNPAAIAVARAVGHAVATAHMADHSLGPVWYGKKAVRAAGQSVEAERSWQDERIPIEVRDLVLSALAEKRFAKL